jgi:hypothetical protein
MEEYSTDEYLNHLEKKKTDDEFYKVGILETPIFKEIYNYVRHNRNNYQATAASK